MKRIIIQGFLPVLTLTMLVFLGCSSNDSEYQEVTSADIKEPAEDHHDHPSEGPHHGSLIELGNEEYHAELVHDDEAETVTIYILDGAAKNTVPIEATKIMVNLKHDGKPEQFQLTAAADEGDLEGKSSRFISDDKELAGHLDEDEVDARIVVTIGSRLRDPSKPMSTQPPVLKRSPPTSSASIWNRSRKREPNVSP